MSDQLTLIVPPKPGHLVADLPLIPSFEQDPWWLQRSRFERGWSRPRLAREMQRVASVENVELPSVENVERQIANWEHHKTFPSPFYAEILRRTFGLPRPPNSRYPNKLRPLQTFRPITDSRQHELHWLEYLRLLRGWSRPRLAREMRQLANAEGVQLPTPTSLARMIRGWEHNDHAPTPIYCEILRRIFALPRPEHSIYPANLRLLQHLR